MKIVSLLLCRWCALVCFIWIPKLMLGLWNMTDCPVWFGDRLLQAEIQISLSLLSGETVRFHKHKLLQVSDLSLKDRIDEELGSENCCSFVLQSEEVVQLATSCGSVHILMAGHQRPSQNSLEACWKITPPTGLETPQDAPGGARIRVRKTFDFLYFDGFVLFVHFYIFCEFLILTSIHALFFIFTATKVVLLSICELAGSGS